MMHEIGWKNLEDRRQDIRLTMQYKIQIQIQIQIQNCLLYLL